MAEHTANTSPQPAGVLRRLAAAVLDLLLLILLAILLGKVAGDFLWRLGAWGSLLGFVIAGAYFIPLNSRWGGGRTLGKRVCGLRVVDATGSLLSPTRAALRYVVMSIPLFLGDLPIPGVDAALWGSLTFFGVYGCMLYLLLFERPLRRLPHDFAARSVVESDPLGALPPSPIWRGHFAICCLILVLAASTPMILSRSAAMQAASPELLQIAQAILLQPGVRSASVVEKQRGAEDGGVIPYLEVTAQVSPAQSRSREALYRVAQAAFDIHPDMSRYAGVVVLLKTGFDLGFWAGSAGPGEAWPPATWQYLLDLDAAVTSVPPGDPVARLAGTWQWTSNSGCTERQVYSADGIRSVVSGAEHTEGRYHLDASGSAGSYFLLEVETLSDDGGKDCADSPAIDTGAKSKAYIAFHPSKDVFALCSEPAAASCWGLYRKSVN